MSMGMEKIPLFAVAPHHLADLQEQNAAEELAVVAPEGVAVAEGITVERVGRPRFGHRPGCACCAPPAALAEALNRLFIRRARAEVAFFRRVAIALPRAELDRAFADVLVSARFRIEAAELQGLEHRWDAGSNPRVCKRG